MFGTYSLNHLLTDYFVCRQSATPGPANIHIFFYPENILSLKNISTYWNLLKVFIGSGRTALSHQVQSSKECAIPMTEKEKEKHIEEQEEDIADTRTALIDQQN